MEARQCLDLFEMLDTIAKHVRETGSCVIPADAGGKFGFIAYAPGGSPDDMTGWWQIELKVASNCLKTSPDSQRVALVQQCFSTANGRQVLAESFGRLFNPLHEFSPLHTFPSTSTK